MQHKFRSYKLAVQFYQQAHGQKAPGFLKTQLLRAASSIALNLSEGSAKDSPRDRKRFYEIALGSTRECEAIVELLGPQAIPLQQPIDILARHIFNLVRAL